MKKVTILLASKKEQIFKLLFIGFIFSLLILWLMDLFINNKFIYLK